MESVMSLADCGGTFDILHLGHVEFLRWSKEKFKTVVVALNTDEFVKLYKAAPVQSFEERKYMLEACRYVDVVVKNIGDKDSKPSILCVHPTHIVNGSDWTKETLQKQMGLTEQFLSKEGIEIAICPYPRTFSTTELKKRIRTQK